MKNAENYQKPLILLTILFFMWGLITVFNDILIPHLKNLFDLNYFQATLIQLCFFSAYFFMSLPAGKIINKYGYKKGIIIGLSVTALGCLLFLPASSIVSYHLFLFAFFILASGITLLQVAANPYVTILGDPATASSRLNLTQAFNSLGTTIAPIIGTFLILDNNYSDKAAAAQSVQLPYIGLAITLLLIAVGIYYSHLPSIEEETTFKEGDTNNTPIFKFRQLKLGTVGIFLYVGGEVTIGSLLVNFLTMPEIGNLNQSDAGHYLSYYWGGAMVGRFLGAFLLQKIKAQNLLSFNAIVVILLITISLVSTGQIAMWSLIAVGLFNSVMFSNIFALSLDGLAKHTAQGSGILCMAIVGGAVIPNLQGLVADAIGLHPSFIIALLCYVYILYYGLNGYKHAKSIEA